MVHVFIILTLLSWPKCIYSVWISRVYAEQLIEEGDMTTGLKDTKTKGFIDNLCLCRIPLSTAISPSKFVSPLRLPAEHQRQHTFPEGNLLLRYLSCC